jgi:hypothetical protein
VSPSVSLGLEGSGWSTKGDDWFRPFRAGSVS